jgi:uncharacterized protein YeaO (DUF488 family)
LNLIVHTAHLSKGGADYLDITRGGSEKTSVPGGHRGMGEAFAPSRSLLNTYLELKKRGELTDRQWLDYAARYIQEMRVSYRTKRATWEMLLSLESVTLCCACRSAVICHRSVLARDILRKLGASYAGELD